MYKNICCRCVVKYVMLFTPLRAVPSKKIYQLMKKQKKRSTIKHTIKHKVTNIEDTNDTAAKPTVQTTITAKGVCWWTYLQYRIFFCFGSP